MNARHVLPGLWLLLLPACGDPLLEPQRIVKPRLLGARLEVEGAPGRASPRAGETLRVRWLLAAPEGTPSASFGFVGCALTEGTLGGHPLECAEPPFARGIRAEPEATAPELELTVPDDFAADALAVLGQVCVNGTTSAAGDAAFTCEGGTSLEASFDVELDHVTPNHHPSLAHSNLRWNGAPWGEPLANAVPGGACADDAGSPAQPVVLLDEQKATIELVLNGADREPIERMEVGPTREALQLSLASTSGELDRAYAFLEAEDERDELPVASVWEAPDSVPAEGQVVRFYFVLRDRRGGLDVAVRDVCVRP